MRRGVATWRNHCGREEGRRRLLRAGYVLWGVTTGGMRARYLGALGPRFS